MSAARRLQSEGSAEERVVGAAEGHADQRAAAGSGLSGDPVAGGPTVAAHQAARPELQLTVVAQVGQAGARDNDGLPTADWADDVDEVGVRGPLTTNDQLCRSAGIGTGTASTVAPVPTPSSQVLGGVVPTPRVDGRSAAQNM